MRPRARGRGPGRRNRAGERCRGGLVVSVHEVVRDERAAVSRIPGPTVARLPLYHRALSVMVERGITHVSSSELAGVVGVNPATLRRDLSRFGTYGTRGTGYEVPHLLARVDGALALDRDWPVAIVGVGHLGQALIHSRASVRAGSGSPFSPTSTRRWSARCSTGSSLSTPNGFPKRVRARGCGSA